jgi:hypothetical protein
LFFIQGKLKKRTLDKRQERRLFLPERIGQKSLCKIHNNPRALRLVALKGLVQFQLV